MSFSTLVRTSRSIPRSINSISIRPFTASIMSSGPTRVSTDGPHVKSPSKPPILLVLDFDGTFTRKDTMHVVAKVGYTHQESINRSPPPRPWSEIVEAYLSDFQAHATQYAPQAPARTTPEQEASWLNSLEQIEEVSLRRTLAAGVFDGVTNSEMGQAGRSAVRQGGGLELRNGWKDLIHKVQHWNMGLSTIRLPFRILSVNWSATFIKGVVDEACKQQQEGYDWVIHANEIPSIAAKADTPSAPHKSSVLTDNSFSPICTSGAKVKILQSLRQKSMNNNQDKALLVYVGDSTTDLECLLAADIGVCIRDDPIGSGQQDLADTCQRIGVEVRPISEGVGSLLSSHGADLNRLSGSRTLWWVRDFHEVAQALDRLLDD